MKTKLHLMESISYRERIALLCLTAILITFGPYFTYMTIAPPTEQLPDLGTMRIFAITVTVQMLILGTGHIYLRVKSNDEATTPPDERDRAIAQRSTKIAYYILIAGMILVGCIMPFTTEGWKLINTAIAAIVIAEVANYSVAIWSYRRGWHD